jgi:hypothetical protein
MPGWHDGRLLPRSSRFGRARYDRKRRSLGLLAVYVLNGPIGHSFP